MTREQFVGTYSYWDSHRPLLWEAMEATIGDIIELGVGGGSTEQLHEYCKARGRRLFSYESSLEYYRQFEKFRTDWHQVEFVGDNWEPMIEKHRYNIGVLFSDEAPGLMRKYNIAMFSGNAEIIIAHDAEQASDHGYRYSLLKPIFRYHKLHLHEGVGTAALSNKIEVNKWII